MTLTATHVVGRSNNAKIGKIATTYRAQTTCPSTCRFLPDNEGGCYATGRINGMATKYAKDTSIEEAVNKVKGASLFRDRVVGDVADDAGMVDYAYIDAVALVGELADVPVFSYTHMYNDMDIERIPTNYVMNASTETVGDAARAIDLGFPTIITNDNVVDGDLINGKRIVTCPAQTRDDVTCKSCKLCSKPSTRKYVIRFLVHGIARNKARKAIENAV